MYLSRLHYYDSQALCQQTLDDWTAKFSPLGIRLTELTSDSTSGPSKGSVSLRDLASADIILTTPEKWDSITRRWKEHSFLVGAADMVRNQMRSAVPSILIHHFPTGPTGGLE